MKLRHAGWIVVLISASVVTLGCGSSGDAGQQQAKDTLTAMLDAWVFGDSLTAINNAHPDVSFHEVDAISNKLIRYEMGPARTVLKKDGDVLKYEFAVTVVFESTTGTEIKNAKTYLVMPPTNKDQGSSPMNKWFIGVQ
jgi:hypothetical protein